MTKLTPEAPIDCELCPRLVEYRQDNIQKYPDWFNGAVPSFEDKTGIENIRLLVIGLAPGLQGANKTGRPFTGDWAGDLLYATLLKFGFASGEYLAVPDDGIALEQTMITNAVRCVPPQNKPIGAEMKNCRPFLTDRINSLPNLEVMICLGRISHENTLSALGLRRADFPFIHGKAHLLETEQKTIHMIDSYHCSRYNTNTGRLTEEMFEDVFRAAKEVLN